MAIGYGSEHFMSCATLEKTGVDTNFATNQIEGATQTATTSFASTGNPTWTTDTTYNGIRAISFSGSSQYVQLSNLTGIDGVSALTMSFWAYRSSSAHNAIFAKSSSNNRLGIFVWNDGNIYFWCGNSVYGSVASTITGWHHYAMVFDSTQAVGSRIIGYIDGVAQTLTITGTQGSTTPSGLGALLLGRNTSGGYATGKADDCRVWLSALSAGTIDTLWDGGRGYQTADTGLDDISVTFRSDVVTNQCYVFPEDDDCSFVDWFRYARLATQSVTDPGKYTVSVDAAWGNFSCYDVATLARPTIANKMPTLLNVESDYNPRPIKVREKPVAWEPGMISAGCYCFDPKPGYVFTDALGTTLAEPGDSVLSMRCRYTNHLITASGAMTFKRSFWGGYYLDTNGCYFSVPAMTGLSTTECFMSIAFNMTTGNVLKQLIGTQTSGNNREWYLGTNNPLQFTGYAVGGLYNVTYSNSTYATTGYRNNVWSALYSSGQVSCYAAQYKTDGTGETGTAGYFQDALYLFKYASNPATDGNFAGAVFAKGATTVEERKRIINWLSEQNQHLLINTVGNSLTFGTGSTGDTNGYPAQSLSSLTAQYGSGNFTLYNTSIGGISDVQALNMWQGIAPYEPTYSNANGSAFCGTSPKVACVWGITNSVGSGTVTARDAVDYMWDLCQLLKQYGFKVIVFPCILRDESTLDPRFRPLMRQANQLIDEEYTQFADIYFPLHKLHEFRDPSDTTYYNVDKVHLNDTGYGIVKDVFLHCVSYCLDGLPDTSIDLRSIVKSEVAEAIADQYVVNVLPFTGQTPDRSQGTTISVFYNEETDVSVSLDDAELDSLTLSFVVEDHTREDIVVIDDADITRSGDTFTVTIPTSVTETLGHYHWALRDITGGDNTLLGHGALVVAYAADVTP